MYNEGCCMQIMSRSQVNDDDYYSNRFIYHIVYIHWVYVVYTHRVTQSEVSFKIKIKVMFTIYIIWYKIQSIIPSPKCHLFSQGVWLVLKMALCFGSPCTILSCQFHGKKRRSKCDFLRRACTIVSPFFHDFAHGRSKKMGDWSNQKWV